ncbi:hypothetical protein KI688_011758 [Linnemannia hyalina]|uniref:rRNA methyltransferase 1, mitochondrial n=1 Tax=Linnemannia hyalina TaxID=64524 RepID=A0A9P7XWZ0_9FUNG|nr:hypothetical protein KI688_011758 [Linnemannia hyalina]
MKDSSSWTDVTPTFGSRDRRSSPRSNSRMSAAGGDDPFERLDRGDGRNDRDRDHGRDKNRDRSSVKFGRSSFPPRESSSRDRFGPSSSPSSRSPRSYNNDSGNRDNVHRGGSGRSYDPSITDRRGGPSQNMASEHDYLYSPNVVIPALSNGFRTPYKLYYSNTLIQNRKKRKEDPVADCIELAKRHDIPVVKTDKHQLNEMSGQRPHQGIVLEASKLKETMVAGLGPVSVHTNDYQLIYKAAGRDKYLSTRENEPPVWIALDEVVDPQNLGAILRTSLFMGVDGVVVCHKNSAPLSAVVAKASAGALEERPTYGVSSLVNFIKKSQENGWHVVGAHVTYGSKRNRPLHTWPETGVDQPTLLIMGSEGNGLRKQVMNQCDSFIQIPTLSGAPTGVDSLNVSVATGIILSKLMGGRFLRLPKNLKKYPHRVSRFGAGVEGEDEEDEDEEGEDKEEEEEDDEEEEEEKDEEDEEKPVGTGQAPKKKSSLPF